MALILQVMFVSAVVYAVLMLWCAFQMNREINDKRSLIFLYYSLMAHISKANLPDYARGRERAQSIFWTMSKIHNGYVVFVCLCAIGGMAVLALR